MVWSLLNIFLLMLYFFLFFIWIWLLISIFGDIFRRDAPGLVKAAWVFVLISLPYLGAFIYLIVNGGDMHTRAAERAASFEAAQADYIRSVSGGGGASTADELAKLAQLRDSGTLTSDEFEAQKAKLLA